MSHGFKTNDDGRITSITRSAAITIVAHDSLSYETASEVAYQCMNLMSLLIGDQLSVRAISIAACENQQGTSSEDTLKCVYQQVGKHDHKDVHPAFMLLPYGVVKDDFVAMVGRWFDRSEQAVLATNIFFGAQGFRSPTVNTRFLAAAQAAESYHRSLGTGLYMDQQIYDAILPDLLRHIPESIQGDHRVSLKNRFKYGNEYSLRKRLADLFQRIPENAQTRIANDCSKFINRVVNTRNYYTHYDHTAQDSAFSGKDAYIAAERLRILVIANLLHDLGVADDKLSSVLESNTKLMHWTTEYLPL